MNGKLIANEIKDSLNSIYFIQPTLAIIKIGNNEASNIYIRNKIKTCDEVGIKAILCRFDDTISESDLISEIKKLNNNVNIHGIIVQLPIPAHLDPYTIINSINPEKDVDGFTDINLGKLMSSKDGLIPATPKGICTLLDKYNINVQDKSIVIIGRSNTVGRPLANLLSNKKYNGNVTLLHSKTSYSNIVEYCNKADIIIACCGVPKFITEEFIGNNKPIVIDVGIHRDENNKLCGDVDYDNIKNKCSYITPVPGGVGPMTVVSLIENTIEAFNKQLYKK